MRRPARLCVMPLVLAFLAGAHCGTSFAASGSFIAANCAPVAAASDGTMVWRGRNSAGLWDAYIGDEDCQGRPLLAPYNGNRGPTDITPDGRYVLLTTAVGWDKALPESSPGRGSGDSIQLYDTQTGRLSTLLPGANSSQRGLIWPTFNANDTKIVWSQMVKSEFEDPPVGEWALHVADVDLETGTLNDNVEWQDPDGEPAFYEAYGWIPNTNLLIFMSTTRATTTGFGAAQLFTLPEELNPETAPTRISPEFPPSFTGQSPSDVYNEFAHFAPEEPNTMYTSIAANTLGDDLWSYDLRTQEPDGLLAQPTRISYFGGNLNLNWGTGAIPGWPAPSYTVVTSMAWENGAWVAATCPDILCEKVNAWRINLGATNLPEAQSQSEPPAAPNAEAVPAPSARAVTRRRSSRNATVSGHGADSCASSPAPGGRARKRGRLRPCAKLQCRKGRHGRPRCSPDIRRESRKTSPR